MRKLSEDELNELNARMRVGQALAKETVSFRLPTDAEIVTVRQLKKELFDCTEFAYGGAYMKFWIIFIQLIMFMLTYKGLHSLISDFRNKMLSIDIYIILAAIFIFIFDLLAISFIFPITAGNHFRACAKANQFTVLDVEPIGYEIYSQCFGDTYLNGCHVVVSYHDKYFSSGNFIGTFKGSETKLLKFEAHILFGKITSNCYVILGQ